MIKIHPTQIGLVGLLSLAFAGCIAADAASAEQEDEADTSAALEDVASASEGLLRSPSDTVSASQPLLAADPNDVYIESITTGGSGCPSPADVSAVISLDQKSFLLIFDKMVLDNPPGPSVKNLNCVAGVKLHVPQGLQVSLATVTTRGYAYLSKGVKARQTSSYFFAGNPLGTAYHSTLTGYFDDNYDFTDQVGIASLVWTKCGESAIFGVNTALNLNAIASPWATAYFNAETVDGKFQKLFHLMWKPC